MFKRRPRYKPHNPSLEQSHFNSVGDFHSYNLMVELFYRVGKLEGWMIALWAIVLAGFAAIMATLWAF